jgi:hypothetical protein
MNHRAHIEAGILNARCGQCWEEIARAGRMEEVPLGVRMLTEEPKMIDLHTIQTGRREGSP